mmetsp:Transcript_35090/g.69140  ORF Transcript_35090/g.69140 Transcript_35090/m.69140 type:complete len:515 (-) Transcript_35090:101-1645(-)
MSDSNSDSEAMPLHSPPISSLPNQDLPPASSPDYSFSLVALLFSVPALGGALFGYDIGSTSFAITQMQDANFAGVSWWQTVRSSPAWTGAIVSAGSAGALLGSFLMFLCADALGRRTELRLGGALYAAGALLEAWTARSGDWGAGLGLTVLLAGRLIYGVGVGITMHGAPTYLSEQSPTQIRGLLISLKEASIVLGILMGYFVGLVFSKTVGGWAMTYGVAIIPAVLIVALSFVIPESCRWLLLQGKEREALESLSFVFRGGHAEREFETLKNNQEIAEQTQEVQGGGNRGIWDPSYRAPFRAGVGIIVLQQITGQPSVLSYATPIFRDAGLSDYATILVAVFKLVATLCAAVTVEKFGRKNLLYTGCSLMLAALIALSLSFGNTSQGAEGTILIAMFVYIGGYQVGFGPIGWLIISEVFPLSVRGQAVAVAVQMNFLLNAIVQFGVPVLESWIGLNFTFATFAAFTAYSIYFVKANVPETKGFTLEEIEQQFTSMYRRNTSGTATQAQPLFGN